MTKKLLALLLALSVVLPILLTGCATQQETRFEIPTNNEKEFVFGKETFVRKEERTTEAGATEAVETEFKLAMKNDQYSFYFNEEYLEFALVSAKTGEVWYSNPGIVEREQAAGLRSEMSSQLSLFYLNTTESSQGSYTSYGDCLLNYDEKSGLNQFYIVNHEGNLRVIYLIGKVKNDFAVPTVLTETEAIEYSTKIKSGGKLAVAKFITGGSIYTKITQKTWGTYSSEKQNDVLSIAPNVAEYFDRGETLYIIADNDKWNNADIMTQVETAMKDFCGMTAELCAQQNELFGVEKEVSNVFWIPIDYSLNKDGLTVTIPNDEIKFDEENFEISSIDLLPYFGSASKEDKGYMFVPDGSGAIVKFNNGKTNITDSVKVPLYGLDAAREKKTRPFDNENGYLPVFGVKNGDKAMFAIIESGDSVATVVSDIAGKSSIAKDRNRIFSSFKLVDYDQLKFSAATRTLRAYQEKRATMDISVRYAVLSGDKANYNGMAEYYRNYLIDNGTLKVNKDKSSIPFNLELIGAYDNKTAFLGVPYNEMRALTTFDQAKVIIDKLIDAGINNISVNYKGWANNGLRNTIFSKIVVINELGGKDGLASLVAYAKEKGINLYFETEMLYVYNSALFDGYNDLIDASRMINREIAKFNQYNVVSKLAKEKTLATIVGPTKLKENFANVLKYSKQLELSGVSLGGMTNSLTGNYKAKDFYDKAQTSAVYASIAKGFSEENIPVMGKGVNAYILPYVDNIFEISNISSGFVLADESVPFYQAVVHGSLQYSGEPINLNGDTKVVFLQAVEAGAGLYYRWCYAPNDSVQDLDFAGMYSLNYSSWIDEAIEMYNRYNDLLGDTAGSFITQHEILSRGVSKVVYENGTTVYVNYNSSDYTAEDATVVKAQDFAVVKGGKA